MVKNWRTTKFSNESNLRGIFIEVQKFMNRPIIIGIISSKRI